MAAFSYNADGSRRMFTIPNERWVHEKQGDEHEELVIIL